MEIKNILAQKLFRTFYQCAYNILINFLLKEQNLKNLIEIWLVILSANFYRACSLYHSLLNGNAFQLFQVCHFHLIATWYFDWKTNGSSRQSFFNTTIAYMTRELNVETPVLQSEVCWILLTLNPFVLSPIVFPICSFFVTHFTFQIYMTLTEWQSISLWIFQTWPFDIANLLVSFRLFWHILHLLSRQFVCSWFSNFLKIWFASRRCQFSVQIFWLFQRQDKISIFIYTYVSLFALRICCRY